MKKILPQMPNLRFERVALPEHNPELFEHIRSMQARLSLLGAGVSLRNTLNPQNPLAVTLISAVTIRHALRYGTNADLYDMNQKDFFEKIAKYPRYARITTSLHAVANGLFTAIQKPTSDKLHTQRYPVALNITPRKPFGTGELYNALKEVTGTTDLIPPVTEHLNIARIDPGLYPLATRVAEDYLGDTRIPVHLEPIQMRNTRTGHIYIV